MSKQRLRISEVLHVILLTLMVASVGGYIYEKTHREGVRERMELAFHSGHAGWWILNVKKNHLEWSEGMFRLYDQKPETWEPSYGGFISAVHPEDREQVNALLKKCYEEGVPYRVGFRIIWPDGQIHRILASGERSYDGRYIAGINIEDSVLRVYE